MLWPALDEDEKAAIKELEDLSDRAAGIVAGALLERHLSNALKRIFHKDQKIFDEFFRTTGVLGSFSAKIDMGRLVGLYSQAAHADLVRIKDIRNAFAHRVEPQHFTTQRISDICNNLTFLEAYVRPRSEYTEESVAVTFISWIDDREERLADPRQRFMLSVQLFAFALTGPAKTKPQPLPAPPL